MAADALEEKILKIRQQNEEIRRRHEEVEADKKNAAQLNALVQLSPSTDWPERREPPEFSSSSTTKTNIKPRNPPREHNDHNNQYRPGPGGGIGNKKITTYPQGEGPPPDPKYNFLADSEREEQQHHFDNPKNDNKNRGKNGKINSRNSFHKKLNDKKDGGSSYGRDYYEHNDNNSMDESHPDYDAWRIERKKIDEARINRQITAEGNWRREWDNDKIYMADDASKKENNRFNYGDNGRHDYADNGDRFYSRGGGGGGGQQYRNSHYSNREFDYDKKVVFADDKSNKGLGNHADKTPRSSVMSVRVSASNIAGTGRVGPRQRTRMMYSSQSGGESSSTFEISTFNRQPSFEEKQNFSQNPVGSKSPHPPRKRDNDKSFFSSKKDDKYSKSPKSPYAGKKDFKNFQKSTHPQRQGGSSAYSMKPTKNNQKTLETSRINASKFSDKKVDFKIDPENKRRSFNFEGERSNERRVGKSKSSGLKVGVGDRGKEKKKLEEDERDVFDVVDEFTEISHDFEITNFEDGVHDDSGYVETICDSAGNVELSAVVDDGGEDVGNLEENNESPVEKYKIDNEEWFENQFENLKIDHFVDEKVEEECLDDDVTPEGDDVDEKNVEEEEEKLENLNEEKSLEEKKDIKIENEGIEIENEENKKVSISENTEDIVLIKEDMVVEDEQNDKASISKESQDVELVKLEATKSLIIEKNQENDDKSEKCFTIDAKVEETPLEKAKEDKEELLNNETVEEREDVDGKLPQDVDEELKEEKIIEEIVENSINSLIKVVDDQPSEIVDELRENTDEKSPRNTDEIEEKLKEEPLNEESMQEVKDSESPANVGEKQQDVEKVDVPIVIEKNAPTTSDIIDSNNQAKTEEANIVVEKISDLTTAKSGSE